VPGGFAANNPHPPPGQTPHFKRDMGGIAAAKLCQTLEVQQHNTRTAMAQSGSLSKTRTLRESMEGVPTARAAVPAPTSPAALIAPAPDLLQVIRLQEKYDHIMLSGLSVPQIMRWSEEIESYTARTGIILALGLQISRPMQIELMARNPLMMTSNAIFITCLRIKLSTPSRRSCGPNPAPKVRPCWTPWSPSSFQ
jgi:hypothetical protein